MLPPQIHVIVRDWLNANHVLFLGGEENVLVDAGYVTHAHTTVRLVRERLGDRALHRLVNTHCHSDHMGGNAAVQRAFGCPIWIPEGEARLIETWDTQALWIDYAGQRAERFGFDATVRPGDRLRMGDLDWDTIAAPGHDMGAVMFWNAGHRILVSGDALWQRGFGIVLPGEGWRNRLAAARATLERIRALDPRVVIPGHGEPFGDAGTAVDRCLARIEAFEADESKLAWHVLKVMLSFALLDLGSLDEVSLPEYLASVPLYREYDRAWFRVGLERLARKLADDLARSGAVVRRAGRIESVDSG
jgi:glyoxylase-like metal-dependent hydrolase (beta-lactamase superfamily II)